MPLMAWGQGADSARLSVRAASQPEYTRLVFESATPPSYIAETSGNRITLTFQKPVALATDGATPESQPRVTSFEGPKGADGKTVTIGFAAGQDVRHFAIGNKIIVDLRGKASNSKPAEKSPAKPAEKSAEKPKTESPPKPQETASEPAKIPPAESAAQKPPETAQTTTVAEKPAEKPTAPEQLLTASFAGTEQLGLAMYERAGRLWVVVDKENYATPPKFEGPGAEKLTPFETIAMPGATAYWMPEPAGLHASAEGGGMVWKLMLSNQEKTATPVLLERGLKPAENKPPELPTGMPPSSSAPATKSTEISRLVWPAASVNRVIDIEDPVVGDTIKVATVTAAGDAMFRRQNYPELSVLPGPIGLAIVPKVDDLTVKKEMRDGANILEITRPKGLVLSPESDIMAFKMASEKPAVTAAETSAQETKPADGTEPKKPEPEKRNDKNLFDFNRWMMGGTKSLGTNLQVMKAAMGMKNDQGQAADLLSLGKMELANGYGPEALGFFDLGGQKAPDVEKTPEFRALRAAAYALSGKHDLAFADLSDPALKPYTELDYWRAFVLAGLEDWEQAGSILPKNTDVVGKYPINVRTPMALTLSEVALREGDLGTAQEFLDMLEEDEKNLPPSAHAAYQYLQGEIARQKDDLKTTRDLWKKLIAGKDDLYRAKAGLALATLDVSKKEMTYEKAIDTLESLRYAWRGDELETAISFRLGQMYIDKGDYVKGLGLLRLAASVDPASEQSKKIGVYMNDTFRDLFLTDKLSKASPMDAATIYEEFSELNPQGADGDKIVRALAERLVEVDLLPRAANLLKMQVDSRVTGLEGSGVANRLAAIYLMDGQPDKALETLNKSETFLAPLPVAETADKKREIALLRARALSDQKKPEDAFNILAMLSQDADVLRLRADIAWQSQRWQDAADSLEQLVNSQSITLTRPLTDDQAETILNWSVALYLSDNRYVLANLRERYGEAMSQTQLAKKFEVVTRPRQNTLLADRETIKAIINEVDMFRDFLKASKETPADAAKTQAAAPAPAVPPKTP